MTRGQLGLLDLSLFDSFIRNTAPVLPAHQSRERPGEQRVCERVRGGTPSARQPRGPRVEADARDLARAHWTSDAQLPCLIPVNASCVVNR